MTAPGDQVDEIAARLDAEPDNTITLRAGDLGDNVDAAARALRRAGVPIFSRGAMLCRPARIEAAECAGPVQRRVGALTLRQVDKYWLRLQLAEAATWQRWDARHKKYAPTEPPIDLALTLIAAADRHSWPALRAISQVPVIAADGSLVTEPGFHAESGLLLNLTEEWPTPSPPDQVAAVAARETLEHLVRHFPFASAADRAVALSLLVTACSRGMLPTAPLHAVDAPEAGVGKSLLVDCAAILATGSRAAVIDYGRDATEAGKRLDAALLAGDAFIAIDNIEAPLEGAALCQTLTQAARTIRIMGTNMQAAAPCSAFVSATGNNLILRGDIVRRALVCRLDPQTDRPELRRFDQDLLVEAARQRADLVTAALTIPRAYILAGRPDAGLSPLGSFEEWSQTVRAALVWAGAADPCDTMSRTRTADPHLLATGAVFSSWRATFGEEGGTVAEAIARAPGRLDLAEALAEVCSNRGTLDARRLGNWLRQRRDSRAAGMVLRNRGTRNGSVRWAVLMDRASGGSEGSKGSVFSQTRASVREELTNRVVRLVPDPSDPQDPLPGDRIEGAARQAGVPVELLRANLAPSDLDDPDLDLVAYARGLSRNASP